MLTNDATDISLKVKIVKNNNKFHEIFLEIYFIL